MKFKREITLLDNFNSIDNDPFFLNRYSLVVIFILFIIVTLFRDPSIFSNPQFAFEDGKIYFKDAYDHYNSLRIWFQPLPFVGNNSPFIELSGRIGVSIAYLFNIVYVPLVIKLLAIIFKLLPAIFFLSKRCENIMPNPYHRLVSCVIFLLLPNQYNMEILLLNARWFMGLFAFLILIAHSPKNIVEQTIDYILLFISCLSGVFIIFIFPIAVIYFIIKKERLFNNKNKQIVLFIMFICFTIQFIYYLHYPTIRDRNLGASIVNFLRIFSGNFIMSGLIGENAGFRVMNRCWWNCTNIYPILFSIVGIFIMFLAFFKINVEGKLFFIFSFLVLYAELKSPLAIKTFPYLTSWEGINHNSLSDRYYFYPTMIWILSIFIVWIHYKKIILKLITSFLILCFLFIGVSNDFLFVKYPNYKTKEILEQFNKVNPGTTIVIPAFDGDFWRFSLKKH